MRISVGIDIAKEIHWVTAIDADGVVQIDRKLLNTPTDIASLADQLANPGDTVRIGIDVIGGIAGLAEAILAEAGFTLVHVPGLAVNRARQGTVGGENKSDPRDARTIAEQVRTRSDLRRIEPATEIDLEIRLLAGRRRDLVGAQTQRLSRMHDLLAGIFPGLEACLDLNIYCSHRHIEFDNSNSYISTMSIRIFLRFWPQVDICITIISAFDEGVCLIPIRIVP